MAPDGAGGSPHPPIPGLSAELWCWLIKPSYVRPGVVAEVRARLAAGERRSGLEVAEAVMRQGFFPVPAGKTLVL
jgi:hypothetical protein